MITKDSVEGKANGLQGKMREMSPESEPPVPEESPEMESLDEEEEMDVEIAEGMVKLLLDSPEAQEVITQAVNGGGEPAAALGVFFAQLIDKIQTQMDETPTPISPRVWLSQDGVLDRVIGDMEQSGLLPEGILPSIKEEVINILKLQNQSVNEDGPPKMDGDIGGGDPNAPPMMDGGGGGGQPPDPMMGGQV